MSVIEPTFISIIFIFTSGLIVTGRYLYLKYPKLRSLNIITIFLVVLILLPIFIFLFYNRYISLYIGELTLSIVFVSSFILWWRAIGLFIIVINYISRLLFKKEIFPLIKKQVLTNYPLISLSGLYVEIIVRKLGIERFY